MKYLWHWFDIRSERYAHVDALRAFSVLLVVVAHSGLQDTVPGGTGVTLFFVISGFVITLTVVREFDRKGSFSIGAFYLRRALKIMPTLIVAVVLPTIVYSFWKPIDWPIFASQIFFVYNWTCLEVHNILPGTHVLWSLSVEEQFYLLFAVAWLIFIRSRFPRRLLAWTASIAALTALGWRFYLSLAVSGSVDRIYYGTDTRFEGIAIGIVAALIAYTWQNNKLLKSRRLFGSFGCLLLAVALLLSSLILRDPVFRDTLRYTMQSWAAALIILYGLADNRGRLNGRLRRMFNTCAGWLPIQILGRASYSIYICHASLIFACLQIASSFSILNLAAIGCVGGIVLFYAIERPIELYRANHSH